MWLVGTTLDNAAVQRCELGWAYQERFLQQRVLRCFPHSLLPWEGSLCIEGNQLVASSPEQ